MSALQRDGMNGSQRNIQPWLQRLLVANALIAASFALATLAGAEPGYPRKPVTIMMPYGAGGLGDVTLRMYAQKFAPRLGQQFIIDARPGAGGAIAARAALAQPADGYTLFFCGSGMAISMSLFKTKPFDIVRDFVQISTISRLDELLLATGANARFNSVKDVVEAARKEPGKITLGSINPGSTQNLTVHMFKQITGIEATIVPYKSVPELITALIRGDVDVGVDYHAGFQPVEGDTRIKILATTGERRSTLLPNVPTLKESGYPDFVVSTWQALAAPRGVPDDILQFLNREMVAATADPEFRERLLKTGQSPGGSTIDAVNQSMAHEVKKWADVIAKAGIALQ
jgi:tripartite-type tricarboxylate transporter receptor subunit TctC